MTVRTGGHGATAAHAVPRRISSVEYVVSLVLFWGGIVSVVLVVAGASLHLRDESLTADSMMLGHIRNPRETALVAGTFVSAREIYDSLTRRPLDPLALVALGLGLLLLTPVAGVAVAALAFRRIRDYQYVAIAALVLTILIASFFVRVPPGALPRRGTGNVVDPWQQMRFGTQVPLKVTIGDARTEGESDLRGNCRSADRAARLASAE